MRSKVIGAGVGSAAVAGGATGLVVGGAWAAVPGLGSVRAAAALTLIAGAVVLDLLAARWPRLGAPCVRRQVPRLWSTVFSPAVTAALYGTRLGVGPLTILPTWLWWAAVVIGASVDPFAGACVGATFGGVRLATIAAVSIATEGAMTDRMARLTRWGRPVAMAVAAAAVLLGAGRIALPEGTVAASAVPDAARAAARAAPSPDPARTDGRDEVGVGEGAPFDDSLSGLLIVAAGPEFVGEDERRPGLGLLDLAEAAAVEDDPAAERALLETRGFETGHARAWRAPDGRVTYAMVYRFGSARGAAAYLGDGFITLEGRGARVYDVAELPAARGFSQVDRRADGSTVAHGVAWARDANFFLVFATGPGSLVTPDDALAVALAQQAHAARDSSG
jgi:hypothetical protein